VVGIVRGRGGETKDERPAQEGAGAIRSSGVERAHLEGVLCQENKVYNKMRYYNNRRNGLGVKRVTRNDKILGSKQKLNVPVVPSFALFPFFSSLYGQLCVAEVGCSRSAPYRAHRAPRIRGCDASD